MKNKKLWIAIAVLALVAVVIVFYASRRATVLSPGDEATLTSGELTVTVEYSRPSVRGRLIFGPEEQKALQPFGKYWRLGANEATQITFNRDVLFNGSPVKAGTYRMYAIPGADTFEIVLNTETGKSGSTPPDSANDVLRTSVPTQRPTAPVEQFTIRLAPEDGGIAMIFEWSDVRFVVPVVILKA
jgi:hypothetical protein